MKWICGFLVVLVVLGCATTANYGIRQLNEQRIVSEKIIDGFKCIQTVIVSEENSCSKVK